jgi:hypothetical protein
MAVRKFRSIEAMKSTGPREPGGEGLWHAAQLTLAMADAGSPPVFGPGVYRHRTVLEWNAQTDAWEAAAIERARARSTPIEERSAATEQHLEE